MTNQFVYINQSNINHFKRAKFHKTYEDLYAVYGLKPNEVAVYSRLIDRLSLSIKNGDKYSDKLGYYIKFDQEELAKSINLSATTVRTIMGNLMKKHKLICFLQEKKGTANKIYFNAFELHNVIDVEEVEDNSNSTPTPTPTSTPQNSVVPSTPNSVVVDDGSSKIGDGSTSNSVVEPDLSSKPDLDVIIQTINSLSNNVNQSFTHSDHKIRVLEEQTELLTKTVTRLNNCLESIVTNAQQQATERPSHERNERVSDTTSEQFENRLEYNRDQIGYYSLMEDLGIEDRRLAEDILLNMTIMHDMPEVVSKRQSYPQAMVQSLLHRFNYDCVVSVINSYKEYLSTHHVTDTTRFLRSCIINECLTHNFNETNEFIGGGNRPIGGYSGCEETFAGQDVDDEWHERYGKYLG